MKHAAPAIWLALIAALPVACWIGHAPRWALGLVCGEALGAVSYLWVGLSLRRGLTKDPGSLRRNWWWHSSLRFAVLGGILYLAVTWPAVSIWAVLAGYTLVQLPAAILRAVAVAK